MSFRMDTFQGCYFWGQMVHCFAVEGDVANFMKSPLIGKASRCGTQAYVGCDTYKAQAAQKITVQMQHARGVTILLGNIFENCSFCCKREVQPIKVIAI